MLNRLTRWKSKGESVPGKVLKKDGRIDRGRGDASVQEKS